ncbi:uncharacterized protein LOC130668406 [Microplitis mediator]|uniref:uncharacterized protein LOC130668406 n=1 Tax=Microplitis mediator TaxID=375433 RepID=UPI002554F3AE|nr:uncharacterized protein LOC130668406 [Microplitis mediator]
MQTLVTLSNIAFIDSYSTDNRSPSTEGVIIGPDTPVYYLEYPHDDYLKVIRDVNKFEASPSYNYYRIPENNSNDTLFLKILVVLDWYDVNKNRPEQDILNEVLTRWNKVDKCFEQLDNPKIKLAIAGVVIPTKSNIGEPEVVYIHAASDIDIGDKHFSYRFSSGCYLIPSFTNNLTKWFNDNADQFESLKYDLFIFMSYFGLAETRNNEDCKYNHHKTNTFACDAKHGSNHRSLGGIAVRDYPLKKWDTPEKFHLRDKDYVFTNNAAYIIASILGVNSEEILGCGIGHIMDSSEYGAHLTWSECSKRTFASMVNNTKYTCLHQIPYDQDEDDYS